MEFKKWYSDNADSEGIAHVSSLYTRRIFKKHNVSAGKTQFFDDSDIIWAAGLKRLHDPEKEGDWATKAKEFLPKADRKKAFTVESLELPKTLKRDKLNTDQMKKLLYLLEMKPPIEEAPECSKSLKDVMELARKQIGFKTAETLKNYLFTSEQIAAIEEAAKEKEIES